MWNSSGVVTAFAIWVEDETCGTVLDVRDPIGTAVKRIEVVRVGVKPICPSMTEIVRITSDRCGGRGGCGVVWKI